MGSACQTLLSGESLSLLADRCLQSSLAEFASADAKKVRSVFCGGVYLAKDTSHPASVRASHASECAQQGAAFMLAKSFGFASSYSAPVTVTFFSRVRAGMRMLSYWACSTLMEKSFTKSSMEPETEPPETGVTVSPSCQ